MADEPDPPDELGQSKGQSEGQSGGQSTDKDDHPAEAVPASEDEQGGEIIELRPGQKKEDPNKDTLRFDLTDWNPWTRQPGIAFPLDLLPPVLRHWAEERASLTGADAAAMAFAALSTVSGAVDHRIRLKPKKHDATYFIHPVLWTMLVGDPSTRKSAAVNAASPLLYQLDKRNREARDKMVEEARAEGLSDKEIEDRFRPARRHTLNDATSEALCEVLTHQNTGIILVRDELSGWIGGIEKYGNSNRGSGQDRSVWLIAHESGSYTQDRIGSGRAVDMLSCSIFGSIQPARLLEMGRLDADGLLQRFVPVMMQRARPGRDEPSTAEVQNWMNTLLADLARLPAKVFEYDDEARALWMAHEAEMTDLSLLTAPSPAFGAFLGKQPRTFCAIALILHLVDIVTGQAKMDAPIPIETARRAREIIDHFIIPHADAFYSILAGKGDDDTQAIATAILKCPTLHMPMRHLERYCRAVRRMETLAEVNSALAPFVYNGWLIRTSWLPDNAAWLVNPDLRGRYRDEVREAEKRYAAIRQKIKQSHQTAQPETPLTEDHRDD